MGVKLRDKFRPYHKIKKGDCVCLRHVPIGETPLKTGRVVGFELIKEGILPFRMVIVQWDNATTTSRHLRSSLRRVNP